MAYSDASPLHTANYLWRPVLKTLENSLTQGATIVDIGCGNGSFARRLLDRGWKAIGVDVSPSAVANARALCPAGTFFHGTVDTVTQQVADQTPDAGVCLEVIEHIYDPDRFIESIRNVLPVGGLLVLSTPYHGYLKNLAIALQGGFDRHVGALWCGGHIKFWSPSTLSALLERNGFRVLAWEGAGRFPGLWKSFIQTALRAE